MTSEQTRQITAMAKAMYEKRQAAGWMDEHEPWRETSNPPADLIDKPIQWHWWWLAAAAWEAIQPGTPAIRVEQVPLTQQQRANLQTGLKSL